MAVPFVGLTGGLGAGKSTALSALERLGAATLSTDAVVHELYASDEVRDAVVGRWGDEVAPEDPLVTLESDKATMDVPSPAAGTVKELLVAVDDTVSEGTPILTLEPAEGADGDQPEGVGVDRRSLAGRRRRPGFFRVERPDQLWHLDMTSVWVAEHGWCYLNAAIDCCTREITGWALDVRCRKRPLGAHVADGDLDRQRDGTHAHEDDLCEHRAMEKLQVEARLMDLPLAERFTIARQTWTVATSLYVKVTYGEAWGWGEVQPADRWDETPRSALEQVTAVDLQAFAGPFDLESLGEVLPAGSARCALDIAFHDLAAKLLGARGVIPDVRHPDLLRLGLSPLSTSFTEVHDGLAVLEAATGAGTGAGVGPGRPRLPVRRTPVRLRARLCARPRWLAAR